MHNNPNWNKDKVKKNSHLMLFFYCNFFTNSLQYSHELEVETSTSVDLLFFGIRTGLWDSNGGWNWERWKYFWRNLTLRSFFVVESKKCSWIIFVIHNYKINSWIFQTQESFHFCKRNSYKQTTYTSFPISPLDILSEVDVLHAISHSHTTCKW